MNLLLVGHGYVGSFLRLVIEGTGARVTVCDEDASRLVGVPNALHRRYQTLSAADLADFDIILWFAGHSSVPKAMQEPLGAISNNCFDLLDIARRKRAGTRLIYASTASLYSMAHSDPHTAPPTLDESQTRLDPVNPYDSSKVAFDALAACFAENLTGLRLGTVCGHSPFLRRVLVFNAKNISAMTNGSVRVANAHAHRPILFLDDLAHYVCGLIQAQAALPRILNVGSYNLNFGELAFVIAAYHKVPVITQPDSVTYSFRTDWRRIRDLVGEPPQQTLTERCDAFRSAMAGDIARIA